MFSNQFGHSMTQDSVGLCFLEQLVSFLTIIPYPQVRQRVLILKRENMGQKGSRRRIWTPETQLSGSSILRRMPLGR